MQDRREADHLQARRGQVAPHGPEAFLDPRSSPGTRARCLQSPWRVEPGKLGDQGASGGSVAGIVHEDEVRLQDPPVVHAVHEYEYEYEYEEKVSELAKVFAKLLAAAMKR